MSDAHLYWTLERNGAVVALWLDVGGWHDFWWHGASCTLLPTRAPTPAELMSNHRDNDRSVRAISREDCEALIAVARARDALEDT